MNAFIHSVMIEALPCTHADVACPAMNQPLPRSTVFVLMGRGPCVCALTQDPHTGKEVVREYGPHDFIVIPARCAHSHIGGASALTRGVPAY